MKKLLTGEALEQRARELGVSFHSLATQSGNDHSILQQRVIEAERAIRESMLWIVALVSAICLSNKCSRSLGSGCTQIRYRRY
jgi:hypothetical protein